MSPEEDARLKAAGIDPADVDVRLIRSPGPGGQNVNKVSTGVQLLHRPSGIIIKAVSSRSQSANREDAVRRLIERLAAQRRAEEEARQNAREKARRRNRPRPRGVQRRILEGKRQNSEKKAQRRRPSSHD